MWVGVGAPSVPGVPCLGSGVGIVPRLGATVDHVVGFGDLARGKRVLAPDRSQLITKTWGKGG